METTPVSGIFFLIIIIIWLAEKVFKLSYFGLNSISKLSTGPHFVYLMTGTWIIIQVRRVIWVWHHESNISDDIFIFIKWLILIASQLVLQTVQQGFCSHHGVKDIIINLVPSSSPPQPPGARRNVKKRESGNEVTLPLGSEILSVLRAQNSQQIEKAESS